MFNEILYERVKELQRLVWKSDDLMDQETLYDVQDIVADIALALAKEQGKEKELVAEFSWLYRDVIGGIING